MKTIYLIAFVIGSVIANSANGQVTVEDPWVRATAPSQSVAGAYMKIRSAKSAALVAVHTTLSKDAAIHEMTMDNGVMRMRPVPRIALPAGITVELKPGGYHLMLMNLVKPLRKGDTVPITLVIEGPGKKQQKLEIKAEVREMAPAADGGEHMHHAK